MIPPTSYLLNLVSLYLSPSPKHLSITISLSISLSFFLSLLLLSIFLCLSLFYSLSLSLDHLCASSLAYVSVIECDSSFVALATDVLQSLYCRLKP